MDILGTTVELLSLLAQDTRLLRLHFPRGDGPAGSTLLANRLEAEEGLSQDFTYAVEVISDDASIPLTSVMGRMVTISMVRDDGSMRYFNGYVFEFGFVRTDGGFAFYRMVLGPWLRLLRLRKDCALFQNMSVQGLCEKTFVNYIQRDYKYRLVNQLPDITLAMQYNETDHNHIHRRLEAAGLFYWYEHREDGHTLWIADDSTVAPPLPGDSVIPYRAESGATEDDGIYQWSPTRTAVPGQVTLDSFNFKEARPARANKQSAIQQGVVPSLEVYESTGAYGYSDDLTGEALAARRLEEAAIDAMCVSAAGNHRGLVPGYWFKLADHFGGEEGSQPHLVVSVLHSASNNYQDGRHANSSYENAMRCIPLDMRWRPKRFVQCTDTRINGLITATVVGPEGEEIHTDEYGRVRVQFHWDRTGKYDPESSPWIRVMTSWAGAGFGQISLPRIGQEVVIQFLDGNCDRPLIVGSVYNAANMPPWDLPGNKTQSGILSRSTVKGETAHANALRFEDKKGAEEVWLHAERDQRIEVEHDESHAVGNDRSKTIDHDETVHVKNDRTETVDHDERITIHNNRTERVDQNETIDIGGDRDETVAGDETLTVHGMQHERVLKAKEESILLGKALTVGGAYQVSVGGMMNTTVALAQAEEVGISKTVVVGQTSLLKAAVQHRVQVGSSELIISPSRIEILADEVLIRGRKKVEVHGDDVDINPA